MSKEKPYLDVPSLEEIEVSAPSLEEIAEDSPFEEEHQSILLDALVEKAERKEKKKQEKEKRELEKLKKELRLLEKKEKADKERARKKCPYTGKRAWKNSLYALKVRNHPTWSHGPPGESQRAVESPPVCKVCNRRHW